MSQPRRLHHSFFAHQYLPAHIFAGEQILGILANPHNQGFLVDSWNGIPYLPAFQNMLQNQQELMRSPDWPAGMPAVVGERLPPDGLGYQSLWLGGQHVVILITFPPAQSRIEARLGAITVSPIIRYLTWETGETGGSPTTLLCEWTRERTHRNYGEFPETSTEAFLSHVCRQLGIPRYLRGAHQPAARGHGQGRRRQRAGPGGPAGPRAGARGPAPDLDRGGQSGARPAALP